MTHELRKSHPDPVVDELIEKCLSAVDVIRTVPLDHPGYDAAYAMFTARNDALVAALGKYSAAARGCLGEPRGTRPCCERYPFSCDHVWCDQCSDWSKDTCGSDPDSGEAYWSCGHLQGFSRGGVE